MMGDKPVTILIYFGVGIVLALFPLVAFKLKQLNLNGVLEKALSTTNSHLEVLYFYLVVALLVAFCCMIALSWEYALYSMILSLILAYISKKCEPKVIVAILAGLIFSSLLPWWLKVEDKDLPDDSFFEFLLMSFVVLVVYWSLFKETLELDDTWKKKQLRVGLYLLFGGVVVVTAFSSGLAMSSAGTMWHHWGAYIGPAQLVSAGALPYYDIPLQYGFGPTVLLAMSGCEVDCVGLFYSVAGLSTVLMTFLVGYLALQFKTSKHPLSVFAVLLIVFFTCLLWTSYPANLLSPLSTPSTSGLRFLPGVLFMSILVWHHKNKKTLFSPVLGHLMWLLCIMWSPEAGVHASVLWVSYYIWGRNLDQVGKSRFFPCLMRTIIELGLVLLGGFGLIMLCYYSITGVWLSAIEYIAYIIHPPGPMQINPYGSVYFALFCLVLWVVSFAKVSGNIMKSFTVKSAYLAALLAFSVFSYYLGRSHDNNILNLLPYLALLLFSVGAITSQIATKAVVNVMLASLVGWGVFFGFENYKGVLVENQLFLFSSKSLSEAFDNLSSPEKLNAVSSLHSMSHESVEIYDKSLILNTKEIYQPWNAIHGPANFVFIPPEERRVYLARVAERLNRSGWVLYDENFSGVLSYIADYDSVYKRDRELSFGSYKAIRFVPK